MEASKTEYEGRGLDFKGVLLLAALSFKRGMFVRRRHGVILSFFLAFSCILVPVVSCNHFILSDRAHLIDPNRYNRTAQNSYRSHVIRALHDPTLSHPTSLRQAYSTTLVVSPNQTHNSRLRLSYTSEKLS